MSEGTFPASIQRRFPFLTLSCRKTAPSPIHVLISERFVSKIFPFASSCQSSCVFSMRVNSWWDRSSDCPDLWLCTLVHCPNGRKLPNYAVGYLAGVAGIYQSLDYVRSISGADETSETFQCGLQLHALGIRTVDRDRVKCISHGNDLCLKGYFLIL